MRGEGSLGQELPFEMAKASRPQSMTDVNRKENSVTQPHYQIPNEMREFAEKGIQQARNAFETFAGAAQKAISSVEPVLPSGVKEVSGKAFSYSEANMNATFAFAQKLVHANGFQEALNLQTDFLKAQTEAFQEQAKELTAVLQKTTTGGKPYDIS